MPGERCEYSPAQHHPSGHDADGPDLESSDIGRLLRIIGVQKAPGERRQHDGQSSRPRHAHQKANGEQAKQKFFAGRRIDTNGQGIDPRQGGAESIGILQILRRPDTEAPPHDVKQDYESNVRGGQTQADNAGTEELPSAQAAEGEQAAKAELVRLACPIEWLTGCDGDDDQQRQRHAFHQRLDEFRGDEARVRIVGVVARRAPAAIGSAASRSRGR